MAEDKKEPVAAEKKALECPRCGWKEESRTVPAEADLQEYVRCLLGGKMFKKKYELYGGKVVLVFRACTGKESDHTNRLLLGLAEAGDERSLQETSLKLKMLYMLELLQVGANRTEYQAPAMESLDQVGEEFTRRFGELGELLLRAMAQGLMMFLDLQQLLVAEGLDGNFWRSAGLRSLSGPSATA